MTESALAEQRDALAWTVDLEASCAAIARAKTLDKVLALRDVAVAAELLVRQRNAASSAHGDTYEIVQRTLRRLGQLCSELPQHPTGGGRPKKTSTEPVPVSKNERLAELGITKNEASEWTRVFLIPEPQFEQCVDLGREKILKTGRPSSILTMSKTVDHDSDSFGTPDPWLDAEREVLGGEFDLDPCSNAEAQKHVRAATWWSKEDDCRKQKAWNAERMHWNPPYSSVITELVARFIKEREAKHIKSAIVVVNNATSEGWFHDLMHRYPVYFTKGRIAFLANGKPMKGNRTGQALFYVGPKLKLFKRVFESKFGGKVMVPA